LVKDDSTVMVKKEFPWINLIESQSNSGFAKGNNLAIPQVKGRYVLFLNPDTLVEKETLKVMLDFMEHCSKATVASCRVELPSGEIDEGCHRGFPTPWNAFCHFSGLEKIFPKNRWLSGYRLGHRFNGQIHQIDACIGAFLLIRYAWGQKVSWWDEDYFWYGDLDFVALSGSILCKAIHYKDFFWYENIDLAPVAKERVFEPRKHSKQ
jgi:hypothetical protein